MERLCGRWEVGDLSEENDEETIERLGLGLMRLEEAMGELREYFGLRPGDLILDLGLFGRYCRASPAESSRARF